MLERPGFERPGFEQAGFEQAGFEQARFEQARFEQARFEQARCTVARGCSGPKSLPTADHTRPAGPVQHNDVRNVEPLHPRRADHPHGPVRPDRCSTTTSTTSNRCTRAPTPVQGRRRVQRNDVHNVEPLHPRRADHPNTRHPQH